MPGLIGFVGDSKNGRPEKLLSDMARALEPEDRYRVELFQEPRIGLGRVSLGILNPGPQPVWNEDESLCLVMEGEVFDCGELKRGLVEAGHRFRLDSDAEFALHLYEEYGEGFAARLNGSFVAAIWDRRSRKLVIVNDRIGQYPLYYAQQPDGLCFASGLRALLADPVLPRIVNKTAVAQFLTFEHALGEHTLLAGVRRLAPASTLTFTGGRPSVQPYWRMRHPDHYPLRSEADWMDGLLHHLRQAISRQAPRELPAGILLSGGIDSRLLLAALLDVPGRSQLHAFTWGIPGCDDARYARELAARSGTRHHFFELRPDWLLSKAEEGVRITDGLGNITNLHAMATLEEEVRHARVLYKGFMGDGMMGYSLRHQHWADYDEPTRVQAHLQVHREQGVILFGPQEHERIFTDAFRREIGDTVFEGYRAGLAESGSALPADQRNVFGLRQRVPRLALNGVEVVRSRAAVRLPFCDNDLVSFALTIPPGLRYQRRLVTGAFARAYPKLAQVPITETGLPMMECARELLLRMEGFVRWHLHAKGFQRVAFPGRRPYKDYNTWFRTTLRHWAESILLDGRSLQRGYFNPDFVQRLVADHMTGANHGGKLGALLSLELWHRRFMD